MCVRRAVREGFEKTSVLSVCVFCFVCFHTAKIQNNRAKCKYLVVFLYFVLIILSSPVIWSMLFISSFITIFCLFLHFYDVERNFREKE